MNIKTKGMRISFLKHPLEIEPLSIITVIRSKSSNPSNIWVCGLQQTLLGTYTSIRSPRRLLSVYMFFVFLKRTGVNQSYLCSVYCSFVRPIFVYGCPVWYTSLLNYQADNIENVQRRAVAIISLS